MVERSAFPLAEVVVTLLLREGVDAQRHELEEEAGGGETKTQKPHDEREEEERRAAAHDEDDGEDEERHPGEPEGERHDVRREAPGALALLHQGGDLGVHAAATEPSLKYAGRRGRASR